MSLIDIFSIQNDANGAQLRNAFRAINSYFGSEIVDIKTIQNTQDKYSDRVATGRQLKNAFEAVNTALGSDVVDISTIQNVCDGYQLKTAFEAINTATDILIPRGGWTGTEGCNAASDILVTANFSKNVNYTNHTGVSITHNFGGTFTITGSTSTPSPNNPIQYDGTWDIAPLAGYDIRITFTGTNYVDDNAVSMGDYTLLIDNCLGSELVINQIISVTTSGKLSTPTDPAKPPTNEQLTLRFTGLTIADWLSNDNNRILDKRTNIGYDLTEIDCFVIGDSQVGVYNGLGTKRFPIDMSVYDGVEIDLELRLDIDVFQIYVDGGLLYSNSATDAKTSYADASLIIFGNSAGNTINNATLKRLEYISEGITLFDCNPDDWVSGTTFVSSTTGETWTLVGDASIA